MKYNFLKNFKNKEKKIVSKNVDIKTIIYLTFNPFLHL